MEAENEAETKESHPPGYWWVKIILGLAIAVLAGVELFADRQVSSIAYAILGTLAAGPEAIGWLGKRTSP